MTPERWQKVKEIFQSALERAPGERSAFLSDACGGDEALRQEVESLIASHEKDGSFIDSPAYQAAAEMLEGNQELKSGKTIGHYEILSTLGKGGMGEVYLARDAKLGRKVALKFLPSDFTSNRERLRRFELEARAASALNHPSIITIYEIGQVDGRHFIATEFIDGQTLRHHILGGPLKPADALNIAEQVVAALVEAHAAGIVHRDIKPDNIMLRRDGLVKLLDFGLAKLSDRKPIDSEDATLALVKTSTGAVMGTASYMSPEQARGLVVDARTDIWSLGVVLYEMLSGQAPFQGSTTSDVLVSVLEREPPLLTNLSSEVPETLEWIVTKALTKEREARYQTATELLSDLRRLKQRAVLDTHRQRSPQTSAPKAEAGQSVHSLDSFPTEPGPGITKASSGRMPVVNTIREWPKRTKLIALVVLLVVAATLIALALQRFARTRTDENANQRVNVVETKQLTFSTALDQFPSLSPDGNSIAYSSDQNGSFEIYVKQLTPGGRDIKLTSDGYQNLQPAWSPDGQRIAYFSQNRGGIWVVPAFGGNPKQLAEFGGRPAWSRDGSAIVFQSGAPREVGSTRAMAPSTLWTISPDGGRPRQITQPGAPRGGHSAPAWSPDGKHIVFQTGEYGATSIWQISVAGGELRKIADVGSDPIYAPNGSEIYLTGVGGESGLSRVKLSPVTGERIGVPEAMAGAGSGSAMRTPAISADGKRIAYTVSQTSSNLWSISLSAKSAGAPVPFTRDTSLRNNFPRFSHDGRKLAFAKARPGTGNDIWLADPDGRNLTQLTTNPANDFKPGWFPQDDRIAFMSDREEKNPTLWSISLATGKEERLANLGEGAAFPALSPDGKQVAFNSSKSGTINMWITPLGGGDAKQLTFSESDRTGFPSWSPDGQFLAFLASKGEDGYVMVMPAGGGAPTQLTFEGVSFVYGWSPDSDKIAFAGERNGIWNIYWISRSTKEQKQLTNYTKLSAFVRYPDWSPLGNQIVYEYAETTGNIWLMELK